MTYPDAKALLRDALVSPDGLDFESRLIKSPGTLSLVDMSTAGELPSGDAYADEVLRALLVIWREVVKHDMIERELLGIFGQLATPIRILGSDPRHSTTRLPQLVLALHSICMSCTAQPPSGD